MVAIGSCRRTDFYLTKERKNRKFRIFKIQVGVRGIRLSAMAEMKQEASVAETTDKSRHHFDQLQLIDDSLNVHCSVRIGRTNRIFDLF